MTLSGPVEVFLDADTIAACAKDAVTGGGQVVALKRTGSAVLAPAHASIELIDHIRGARTGPVPVSVMLEGEYGINNLFIGVPIKLGASGVEQVIEIGLTDEEKKALDYSASAVQELVDDMKRLKG